MKKFGLSFVHWAIAGTGGILLALLQLKKPALEIEKKTLRSILKKLETNKYGKF